MAGPVIVFSILILCIVLMLALPRISRPTANDPTATPKPGQITVSSPDGLLTAINDIFVARYPSGNRYVVKIDATQWDWNDLQNARWLQRHPDPRIRVISLKLPK